MKNVIFLIMFPFFIFGACKSQTANTGDANYTKKRIIVSFTEDDNPISLSDQFVISFINAKDTIRLQSSNNILLLPEIPKDKIYKVLFSYSNYNFKFDGITKQMIFPGQDVEWKFGIDKRPFNRSIGLLSEAEYKSNTYRELQYLQFDLQEFGDGIQIANKIP